LRPALNFQDRNRGNEQVIGILRTDPLRHIGICFTVSNFAQLGDDVCIQQVLQDRSTSRGAISALSGSNSIVDKPGIERASTRFRRLPVKRSNPLYVISNQGLRHQSRRCSSGRDLLDRSTPEEPLSFQNATNGLPYDSIFS